MDAVLAASGVDDRVRNVDLAVGIDRAVVAAARADGGQPASLAGADDEQLIVVADRAAVHGTLDRHVSRGDDIQGAAELGVDGRRLRAAVPADALADVQVIAGAGLLEADRAVAENVVLVGVGDLLAADRNIIVGRGRRQHREHGQYQCQRQKDGYQFLASHVVSSDSY